MKAPSAEESECESEKRLPDVVLRLLEQEVIEVVPFVEGGWQQRVAR
jgi:hypothetical protein